MSTERRKNERNRNYDTWSENFDANETTLFR